MTNNERLMQPLCLSASAAMIATGAMVMIGGLSTWNSTSTGIIVAAAVMAYGASASGVLDRVPWMKVGKAVSMLPVVALALGVIAMIVAFIALLWIGFVQHSSEAAVGTVIASMGVLLGAACPAIRRLAPGVTEKNYWSIAVSASVGVLLVVPLAFHLHAAKVQYDAIQEVIRKAAAERQKS